MKKLIFILIAMLLPLLASADANGTCGENLTWSYVESTNTLTISGTGEMPDYSSSKYKSETYNDIWYFATPWYGYRSNIQNVIIESGVTSIGNGAFYDCSGLTSVTIPNSVTRIGYNAFDGCSSLTFIMIPNSMTTIGNGAFSGCTGLTSIIIPNSVTSIGNGAFYRCYSLSSITIPNSVTSIGSDAFSYCNSLSSITIPNSVTSIGEFAFSGCSSLTSITIPNSVTSIGSNAFYGCSSLTSVTIPNNMTRIGEYAFHGCTGLISLIIPNSVTSIGEYAFSGCSGLTSITIPNSVTSIGEYAFSGCSGLTSITIPNSVTSIGKNSFYCCTGLTSVIIGSGVTSIGSGAFNNTKLRKTIWLTNTPPSGSNNASGAVNYVSNEQYYISNKVVYPFLSSYFNVDGIIYVPVNPSERTCDAIDCVYDNSAANTKISSTVTYKGISMSVKKVQPYVCYNNNFIETLTCDNDGDIAQYAFNNCINMKQVSLGENITAIGDCAFQNCSSLQSLVIPNSVKEMGKYAFDNCISLNNATIGNKVNSISQYSFSNCISITNIVIGNQVKDISEYAFSSCKALSKISIPKSVTKISNNVFKDCRGLKEFIIEDRDDELTLGSNGSSPMFSDCPLDSVYIGGNISYNVKSNYGYPPFYRNTTLRTVVVTDKETEISPNEFYGCTNLQSFTVGEGVTSFGDWAFSGCSSLKTLSFGSQLKAIGKEAFSDCVAVTEITSKATTPPICDSQALDDINKWECKLIVPKGCMAAYKSANQWKEFFFMEENGVDPKQEYTLTYVVDGEVYKTITIKEDEAIAPEEEPTKEGYTFSGWSEIPETMPAHDVTVTGTFSINKYKLIYTVDGEEYKSYEVEYGATITPEAEPMKEGYTFSRWSEIPETMPAHDVTVTGTFSINKYTLTYTVDGEEYKSYEVEYGATITSEAAPTKEGYTFSGWSEIPETMPAHDVTVTGTFIINKYKLTYTVNGEEYKTYEVEYGSAITPEAAPTKEGYTFSGWSEIPETMPAQDVTVIATFSINSYMLTYIIDDKVYKETMYEYGATIIPESQPEGDYQTFEWTDLPQTMPAHDVVVYASYTSGIFEVLMASQHNVRIYSPNGKKLNKLQKGLNIVILCDGTVKKIIMK